MKEIKIDQSIRKLGIILFILYSISIFTFVDHKQLYVISQICFILFAGISVVHIMRRGKIHVSLCIVYLYIWIIWCLISCIGGIDVELSFKKIITIFQLAMFAILMHEFFYDEKNVDNIIKSLLIGGLFMCVYTILYYGPLEMINAMNNGLRLGAEISQENVLGINAANTFLICMHYIINKKCIKLIPLLILPFIVAFSTGSRKALVIIIVGILMIITFKYGVKKFYKLFLVGSIIFIVLFVALNLPMFKLVQNRMEGLLNSFTGSGKVDNSTTIRMEMIDFGLEEFSKQPISGYGIDNYRVLYKQESGWSTYSHNNYIEIMVGTGIIGFIIYYSIYFYILLKLIPFCIKKDSTAVLITIITIINLFIDYGTVSYYNKLQYVYLVMALLYIKNIQLKKYELKRIYEYGKN